MFLPLNPNECCVLANQGDHVRDGRIDVWHPEPCNKFLSKADNATDSGTLDTTGQD